MRDTGKVVPGFQGTAANVAGMEAVVLAGSEGARRATGEPARTTASIPVQKVETEVRPSKKRRRLTAAYKLKIIRKVTSLREENSGQIGPYLRSEGLYYAAVSKWEQQLKAGTLGNRRAPRKPPSNASHREKESLKRKIVQLEKKLEKANLLLELQKKISELTGLQQVSLNG